MNYIRDKEDWTIIYVHVKMYSWLLM